jgi:uncharacterized protein (DUF433 family)
MKRNGKRAAQRLAERVELGKHIVADPEVCHGKPTFKGTRIMIWQVLEELGRGMSPDEIVAAWGGKISRAAIAESVQLARRSLLDKHGQLLRPDQVPVAA